MVRALPGGDQDQEGHYGLCGLRGLRDLRELCESAVTSDHSVLIRNATILTMNDALDIVTGAVSVRDGRIQAVGSEPDAHHDTVIDAGGAYLLPGFIQTHVHLCQTLFRSYADDLPLLEWLRTRVW